MNKCLSFMKQHELFSVTALCVILAFLCCVWHILKVLRPEDVILDLWSEEKIAAEVAACPVDFENDLFLVAVSRALDCSPKDLTEECLMEVETLKIDGLSKLTNINDIRFFPNLKHLTISNCGVRNIMPLSGLTKMECLDLSGNRIRDIGCLSQMSQLQWLDVSQNQIESFSHVEELGNLIEVDFADNLIKQIENLSSMKSLTKLSVADNPINDLSFVKTGHLISLNISNCNIEDLSMLSTCVTLEELHLYGYSQIDLSPLHKLPNFNSLFLDKEFDRSQVMFLCDRFKTGDNYTKIYLVAYNRGLELARSDN